MTLVLIFATTFSNGHLETRKQWLPVVKAAAQYYQLDWQLLDALIFAESTWNPMARSEAGAIGLAQLMPTTAAMLGVTNPWDPGQNIWGAALYLNQLYSRFGNWRLTLAAYNAGPTRVSKCQCVPFLETLHYVNKIMKDWGSR